MVENELIIGTKKWKNIFKKINIQKIICIGLIFLICYFISELLNGNEIIFNNIFSKDVIREDRIIYLQNLWKDVFKLPKFWVNYFLFIFLYWILYGFTNRTKVSCIVITVCTYIFGISNYLVRVLRGNAISVSDIFSIRTALNVAKGLKPSINGNFIIATILFIVLLTIIIKEIKFKDKSEIRTTLSKNITIVLGVVGVIAICIPDYFTKDVELWNLNAAYANSGAGITLVRMAKDLKINKPRKYSSKEAKKIISEYQDDTEQAETEDFPNVVVIMNESFADLQMAYNIELAEDPLEFYHELINQSNIVTGVMHSSQYGGGTANVEYEFITQNSTAFLPSGSMPYQQYIKGNVKQSIVAYMNKLGYNTYGMHSWDKKGYSRHKIYKYLEFKNIKFKDDMTYLKEGHSGYPSDQSTYEEYYDIMNNKPAGEKNFTFIVTMQNHLPYNYVEPEGIQFTEDSPDITSYLQSEYLADKALKNFIQYLENYDEKVIVLFFGDHQPNLNQQNIYEITDAYNEDTASQVVPFFIWANYEIEGKSGVSTSTNYLESLLLDTAKMPTDSYTKYIEKLREELPIITNNYYMDKENNMYRLDDKESPYYEKLQEYWKLIYYNIFDNKE